MVEEKIMSVVNFLFVEFKMAFVLVTSEQINDVVGPEKFNYIIYFVKERTSIKETVEIDYRQK